MNEGQIHRRAAQTRRRLKQRTWNPAGPGLVPAAGPSADATIDTVYRAVLGRAASSRELRAVKERAAAGLAIDDLIGELRSSGEGRHLAVARGTDALRAELHRDFHDGRNFIEPAPRLVFLHIMKVGGTSLAELFGDWVEPDRSKVHIFLEDLLLAPRLLNARLRLITGHIPFEALELIPGPFSTLCVLRDPYARTISHLSELKRKGQVPEDLSLDEFLSNEVYDVPSGNYQARHLALRIGLADAWVRWSPEEAIRNATGDPEGAHPLQSMFDSTPITDSDDELLTKALSNLESIDFVGVTESIDRVGRAVAAFFGTEPQPVPHLNVSAGKDADDIPRSIRRRIDARTAVDRELYDHALIKSGQL